MRRLLAFLVAIAMVFGPVAAIASPPLPCSGCPSGMAGMSAMSMAHDAGDVPTATTPRDHGGGPAPHRDMAAGCFQCCVSISVTVIAPRETSIVASLAMSRAVFGSVERLGLAGYPPAGLDRPPKTFV